MKTLLALVAVAVSALAVAAVYRLSTEATAAIVGLALGILIGVPCSFLFLAYLTRRIQPPTQQPQDTAPQPQPPTIVVVQPPNQQPILPQHTSATWPMLDYHQEEVPRKLHG